VGVKCERADLVSIYTSFCVGINKDGQSRDWKNMALAWALLPVLLQQRGEERNVSCSVVRLC